MDLEFHLINQILTRTDNQKVIQKSKNIYQCHFTINGEIWDNLEIFAIFSDSFNNKRTVPLGKGNELSCVLPNFVLKGTFFKVSLFAGDLITTNIISIPLLSSLYGNFDEYVECEELESKNVFVSIFESLDCKVDEIRHVNNFLEVYAGGELIESIYMPIADEAFVDSLKQEFIVDDALSDMSLNPVQNKVINTALGGKADTVHTHVSLDVTDLEDSVDLDLDRLLINLTENIRQI